jgi:hypothetical protein
MIFEELIKDNKVTFIAKVVSVASFLGVRPEWLMFLMWFETGHTLDSKARNKITGAIGLIQFMPATARFLGTTCELLAAMSNVQQMDYVKKHLGIFKGKYKDWVDLYCGIFWPAAVGKPDTYRITPDIVAKQNPLFDIDKDGDIEKVEIRTALLRQIPAQYKHYFITI